MYFVGAEPVPLLGLRPTNTTIDNDDDDDVVIVLSLSWVLGSWWSLM